MPRGVKPAGLAGVAEIDETYVLESFKGQKVVGRAARKRGGAAAKRGLSREQTPILVARDRSGTTTDYVLADNRKGAVMAVLKPLLPADGFHGVGTSYLENYLGWFRAIDRTPRSAPQAAQFLDLAVGA